MNVLFMTIAYPSAGESNLYSDLMQEFHFQGHQVYVLCSCERRHNKPTRYCIEQGVQVLRVRTGNLTKSNLVEKGLSTIYIEYQYINSIKKFFPDVRFDLVLYSTPPITLERPIRFLKQRDSCISYLLLKDIFPQNAVDMGYLRPTGLTCRYFRSKEKTLYHLSDFIGCMSPANKKYLNEHNPSIDPDKVEVCPNSIKPRFLERSGDERKKMCADYGIPPTAVVFLYGGSLGKPQGLGFFLEAWASFRDREDVFFLVVGSGTEYEKIEKHLKAQHYSHVRLVGQMTKSQYDSVLIHSDVGLIFLDPRFTIPNFPSRLTAYMEAGLPVIAATDRVSDIKECLAESGCGVWMENGDVQRFAKAVDELAASAEMRNTMGKAGRLYLEEYFNVSRSVKIILNHLQRV